MFQSYSLRAAELESQKQRGLFLDKNDITSLLSLLQSWNDSFVSVVQKGCHFFQLCNTQGEILALGREHRSIPVSIFIPRYVCYSRCDV